MREKVMASKNTVIESGVLPMNKGVIASRLVIVIASGYGACSCVMNHFSYVMHAVSMMRISKQRSMAMVFDVDCDAVNV